VANKSKQQERDRRAKVEAMRRAEQSKERRKSMLFVVLAGVVGLGLVAAAAVPAYLSSRNDPANKPLSSFGVNAAAADCDEATDDPATGGNDHREDGTAIEYDQVPPSSGPHWAQPAFPARAFYTDRDRPAVEQLVPNLEHGYTILWYDDTVTGADRDELEKLAASAREDDNTRGKFIVAPWDEERGRLPEGKHVALTHWGAEQGHRQLCGAASGAVVEDFVSQFPAADSPEPNAA
jgi:hypothetical protein